MDDKESSLGYAHQVMADPCGKNIDPRVLRTRHLLQHALHKLLETRDFEELSVQDITDAATVNRATFYAHYPDKYALLECLVARRFHELLSRRGVTFDGTCRQALKAIVVTVCDFLEDSVKPCGERPFRIQPQMEWAIIAVVRSMILDGAKQHPPLGPVSPETLASTASWAIYGGAKEWVQTAGHGSSEEAADMLMLLIASILNPARPAPAESWAAESPNRLAGRE